MTCLRFFCAFLILFTDPFSLAFWILYINCGMSDVLDGIIARRLHIESQLGAKLDSIADMFCILVLVIVLLPTVNLPRWMWLGIIVIALVRIVSYLLGFIKYHTFSSLHTYLNKVSGLLLFITPILYVLWGMNTTGMILYASALLSALEELLIILLSKNLHRNCKSILNVLLSND